MSSFSTHFDRDPHTAPATAAELDALLRAFEGHTLPRTHWTHAAHLVVGSHYVFTMGLEDAMTTMRQRVRSYNEATGTLNTETSGYHKTLTRMWLMALAHRLTTAPGISGLAFAQLAVRHYGPRRDLHRTLYSFDVVKDTTARRTWVAPDLWIAPDLWVPPDTI